MGRYMYAATTNLKQSIYFPTYYNRKGNSAPHDTAFVGHATDFDENFFPRSTRCGSVCGQKEM